MKEAKYSPLEVRFQEIESSTSSCSWMLLSSFQSRRYSWTWVMVKLASILTFEIHAFLCKDCLTLHFFLVDATENKEGQYLWASYH